MKLMTLFDKNIMLDDDVNIELDDNCGDKPLARHIAANLSDGREHDIADLARCVLDFEKNDGSRSSMVSFEMANILEAYLRNDVTPDDKIAIFNLTLDKENGLERDATTFHGTEGLREYLARDAIISNLRDKAVYQFTPVDSLCAGLYPTLDEVYDFCYGDSRYSEFTKLLNDIKDAKMPEGMPKDNLQLWSKDFFINPEELENVKSLSIGSATDHLTFDFENQLVTYVHDDCLNFEEIDLALDDVYPNRTINHVQNIREDTVRVSDRHAADSETFRRPSFAEAMARAEQQVARNNSAENNERNFFNDKRRYEKEEDEEDIREHKW